MDTLNLMIDFDKAPYVYSYSPLPDSEQLQSRVRGQVKFDPSKIELYLDEGQKGLGGMSGHSLHKKLEGISVCGAQLLNFYLANQSLIPEEWKSCDSIQFWGTLINLKDGEIGLLILHWNGAGWYWDYNRLGNGFWSETPAVILTHHS